MREAVPIPSWCALWLMEVVKRQLFYSFNLDEAVPDDHLVRHDRSSA
jgi:hypothetical protein